MNSRFGPQQRLPLKRHYIRSMDLTMNMTSKSNAQAGKWLHWRRAVKSSQIYGQYLIDFGQNIDVKLKQSHQRFLDHMLSNFSITHPCISEILHILVSVFSSTGSLEKPSVNYVKFAIRIEISWQRNTLRYCTYCASWQFKGNEADYKKAIKILEI